MRQDIKRSVGGLGGDKNQGLAGFPQQFTGKGTKAKIPPGPMGKGLPVCLLEPVSWLWSVASDPCNRKPGPKQVSSTELAAQALMRCCPPAILLLHWMGYWMCFE